MRNVLNFTAMIFFLSLATYFEGCETLRYEKTIHEKCLEFYCNEALMCDSCVNFELLKLELSKAQIKLSQVYVT